MKGITRNKKTCQGNGNVKTSSMNKSKRRQSKKNIVDKEK